MKRTYLIILLLFSTLLLSFSLQDDPLAKITKGFARYLTELPQEKIYVHFDRPYYTVGETIWFKAYLAVGPDHQPTAKNNTVYAELLNEKSQLIQRLNLLTMSGSAAGNFDLPDTLSSGNYTVRAYTNWMKNQEEDYFFHRQIKIFNPETSTHQGNTSAQPDIRFFPEGGDLVAGIFSKVAVKAIGPDGLGIRVKGKISDGTQVIAEFKSNSLGMGVFHITPQKGKQYKAILDSGQEILLPVAKDSGLVMTVTNSSRTEDVLIKIQTTDYTALKTIYIVSQARGVISFAARADLATNIAVAKIPKAKLASGITQITITDSNGIPLSERLIFVNSEDQLRFNVTPDKATYAPRELVTLQIQVTDAAGSPVVTDASLTVCDDQGVLPDQNKETIQAYLLLSSELRGHIESPGYYFNPKHEDREEALDYLLLTQGWRRFTFQQAMEENWIAPRYRIEQGLTVKGKLVSAYNSKPVAEGKVSYLSVHPVPETKTVTTDANGSFRIDDIIYYQSHQAMLQGETKKGSKAVKIVVDTTFDSPPLQSTYYPLIASQTEFEKSLLTKHAERKSIDKTFNFGEKVVKLGEVEIRSTRDGSQPMYTKAMGKGTVSMKVAGNPAIENLTHPLMLVQGRVAGVQVVGSWQDWRVTIQGVNSILSGTTPLFLIDNIPVSMESLSTLAVSDIESFSVWKGADAAIFGSRGANGAIGFYTKKNPGYASQEGTVTFGGTSLLTEREFYAPKYDVEKPEHIKPDRRVTIFWAPFIQTDSLGRATVTFYNHDMETTVSGTLEGISAAGNSGSASFTYSIEKK
jgi:hypothetical protein